MRALVALALVLAACGSSAQAPALQGRAAKRAPSGPAPTIAFTGGSFDVERLPAVARTGELVALAITDSDSGRGNPNLRLEVRGRDDRITDTLVVLAANDFETLVPDGVTAAAALEARITAANRKLIALHDDHDLVPMQLFATGDTFARATSVEGDALSVSFADDNRLRVRNGTEPLATVDGSTWLAPKGPRCAQCPVCENPAWLDAMFKARDIDVIVVRIQYSGTDTCWEPPAQLHVIAW